MTEKEAIKLRSAFSNGFQYPFGGGFVENCEMDEVKRHAELLDEAVKKQIPREPILTDEQSTRYSMDYECPNCHKKFTVTGIADYCYHCGQALKWELYETNDKQRK